MLNKAEGISLMEDKMKLTVKRKFLLTHLVATLWTLAAVALTSYPIIELTGFRASIQANSFWNLTLMWIAYSIALLIVYMLALGKLKSPLWALAIIALTLYPIIELSRYISAYHGIFPLDAFVVELGFMWFYYYVGVLILFTLVTRNTLKRRLT